MKLKEDFGALKVRIVKQEDYSRRENLRFYNIPESAQETNEECVQKVKQVLSDLGAPHDVKFHAIYRTGKPYTNSGDSSKVFLPFYPKDRSTDEYSVYLIYFISTAFCSLIIVYCDIICIPKSTFVLSTLAANFAMFFFSYLAFVFFITSVNSPNSQGSKFRFKS